MLMAEVPTDTRNRKIRRRCRRFADEIHALFGDDLLAVRLFGSCATGTNHAESDIDIAIILTEAGKKRYEENIGDIAFDCDHLEMSMTRELSMPVSLLIWSEARLSKEIAFGTSFASRLLEKSIPLFQREEWTPE